MSILIDWCLPKAEVSEALMTSQPIRIFSSLNILHPLRTAVRIESFGVAQNTKHSLCCQHEDSEWTQHSLTCWSKTFHSLQLDIANPLNQWSFVLRRQTVPDDAVLKKEHSSRLKWILSYRKFRNFNKTLRKWGNNLIFTKCWPSWTLSTLSHPPTHPLVFKLLEGSRRANTLWR